MEHGPRFDREPFFERRRETRDSVQYLLSQEGLREYLANPQNVLELENFFRYVYELDLNVSRVQPATEREADGLHQEAQRAVEQEALPPLQEPSEGPIPVGIPLPPPVGAPKTLFVGDHMTVSLGYTAADQWPDARQSQLQLSDDVVVVPHTPVGIIDFYRNITQLNTNGSLIGFSRALITSAADSLTDLAHEVEERNAAEILKVFSGMSHLARLAKRFGFTVFDIQNDLQRQRATGVSMHVATGVAQQNNRWQELARNYKPAQVAMISSTQLLRRFKPR